MEQIQSFYPDLSPERIDLVANRVVAARNGVSKVNQCYSKQNWGVACLACQVARDDLLAVSAAGTYEWLKVQPEQGMAYTVIIGKTPLRVQPESDVVRPVMSHERSALNALAPTMSMFSPEFMPGRILRMEVTQQTGNPVSRVAVCLIEERSELIVDTWIVYGDDKAANLPANDFVMGRAPQDANTDNIYQFNQEKKTKSDGET
jgi:hypothetical protein